MIYLLDTCFSLNRGLKWNSVVAVTPGTPSLYKLMMKRSLVLVGKPTKIIRLGGAKPLSNPSFKRSIVAGIFLNY